MSKGQGQKAARIVRRNLSFDQKRQIGARFKAGESIGPLSVEFGVSRQRIYQIVQETFQMRPKLKLQGHPKRKTASV